MRSRRYGNILTLGADITSAWFQLITAQLLLELFTRRLRNMTRNQQVIQQTYELGTIGALDVYLS